jgi:ATP-dependent RNA helicase DDX3X
MVQGRYGLATAEENATLPKPTNPSIDFSQYDNIPVELSGRNAPKPIEKFSDVNLGRVLMENIKIAGYDRPTPVQKNSIPTVLADRDLMACAQTGSGKTAAFLFPIIAKLVGNITGSSIDYHRRVCYPSALVLAPTRELACQIEDECRKFCAKTGLRSLVVYGGSPMVHQLRSLETYGCDILVATPGRLVDIIDKNKISLSRIRYLVLDEADRMLDMGFEPQIRKIVEQRDMPQKGQRRTLMFSATFPKEIQQLASSFLEDYLFLAVGRVGSTTDLVTQHFIKCEEREKLQKLFELLRSSKEGLTLIFVEKKKTADSVGRLLSSQGFRATAIHGDRAQRERTAAIRTFSTGETPFLVATNVAARGLDIDNVTHVVNFDMPNDIDDYVHRIGRTGRAGKKGISTTFITPENTSVISKLVDLLDDAGNEVPKWMDDMKFDRTKRQKGGFRFGGTDFRRDGGRHGSGGFSGGAHPGSQRGGHTGGYNRGNVPYTQQPQAPAPWGQGQQQQAYPAYGTGGYVPFGYPPSNPYSGYPGYGSYGNYPPANPPQPPTSPTQGTPQHQTQAQPPAPAIGPMRPPTSSHRADYYKPY